PHGSRLPSDPRLLPVASGLSTRLLFGQSHRRWRRQRKRPASPRLRNRVERTRSTLSCRQRPTDAARHPLFTQPTPRRLPASGAPIVTSVEHSNGSPLRLRELYDGKRLVVIGGTGFLGKVWWSLLLDRLPEI